MAKLMTSLAQSSQELPKNDLGRTTRRTAPGSGLTQTGNITSGCRPGDIDNREFRHQSVVKSGGI